jgi:hypothetical protein
MNLKYEFDHLSIQNYLEGELLSPIKHEYIDGKAYAMVGDSSGHKSDCFQFG